MALFKNKDNGNVIKVYGPVADAYSKRDEWTEVKPSAPKSAKSDTKNQPANK